MDLGGHTLFRDTLRRVMDLECALPPLILCNEEQRFLAAAQLQALAQEQGRESTGKIILEPEGRNTAPAIGRCGLCGSYRGILLQPLLKSCRQPGRRTPFAGPAF